MRRLALSLAIGLSALATGCGRGDDQTVSSNSGGLCGRPALAGEVIGPLSNPMDGCGSSHAIRLEAVGPIRLSRAATMDCPTARALETWVKKSAVPEVGRMGGGLSGLRVVAHYACRTRNNQPGARISEHGRGKAIDIAALQLRDGSEISVLSDWGQGPRGRVLRQTHRGACGPFCTVLGPKSDRHHQDHFHFDTASHRGGPYCR